MNLDNFFVLFWWFFCVLYCFSSIFARQEEQFVKCPGYCNVLLEWYNNSDDLETQKSVERCKFVPDTLSCENRTKELLEIASARGWTTAESSDFNSSDFSYPPCPSNVLDVDITPYIFHPGNYRPYPQINVSLTLLRGNDIAGKKTLAVALRHTCLANGVGPHGVEQLCINQSRPSWGRFYWPCRMFDFSSNVLDDFGESSVKFLSHRANFSYACYRAAPLALMTVRIALLPQMCENVYVYRMVAEQHMAATVLEDWMPLALVDINDEHYVTVKYSLPPEKLRYTSLVIDIVDAVSGKTVDTKTVQSRDGNAFRFTNLKRGRYAAMVHVWHSKCYDHKCKTTNVLFNLTRDYAAPVETSTTPPLEDAWKSISVIVGVLLTLLLFVAASLTLFCRMKIRRRRQQAVALQFVDRPKVFLIYTDDSIEHRQCVIRLAEYLRNLANCTVFLDEWTFRNPSSRAIRSTITEWVYDCMSKSDYYILLFSEGSKCYFENPRTRELNCERPWPETFGLSINYVLSEILRETRADPRAKLSKIVSVTFDYSQDDCVPPIVRSLPCRQFRLLADLADLICALHRLSAGSLSNRSPLGADSLAAQVEKTCRYYRTNPHWLSDRLSVINNNVDGSTSDTTPSTTLTTVFNGDIAHISAAIESLQTDRSANADDRRTLDDLFAKLSVIDNSASTKYPLLPPPVSANSADSAIAENKYDLLPPDDDEINDNSSPLMRHTSNCNGINRQNE